MYAWFDKIDISRKKTRFALDLFDVLTFWYSIDVSRGHEIILLKIRDNHIEYILYREISLYIASNW